MSWPAHLKEKIVTDSHPTRRFKLHLTWRGWIICGLIVLLIGPTALHVARDEWFYIHQSLTGSRQASCQISPSPSNDPRELLLTVEITNTGKQPLPKTDREGHPLCIGIFRYGFAGWWQGYRRTRPNGVWFGPMTTSHDSDMWPIGQDIPVGGHCRLVVPICTSTDFLRQPGVYSVHLQPVYNTGRPGGWFGQDQFLLNPSWAW